VVDLPIARARATQLPLVPGSAIKGVLRDDLPGIEPRSREHKALFGPESTAEENAHAGALAVGDAHLLILPVRSFNGIVAFATCPFILGRYARDRDLRLGIPAPAPEQAVLAGDSVVKRQGKVLLEDLDLTVRANDDATPWASSIAAALYPGQADWQNEFRQHFVILSDNVFSFLADTATEIRARVRINDQTRTVARGALWYEENLPAESVLWGVIGISGSRTQDHPATAADLADLFPRQALTLQIGGKHTVGRGLCRFLLS
jgi:CRISPR-associated protein Cmr4